MDDPATDADAIDFGTDGWRATLDVFTTPRLRMVGQAVASYLRDEGRAGAPVLVGYDAREGSRGFAEALADVLAANGHDVSMPTRDRPTPLVAHAIVDRGFAGALMVTASHNPPAYNGVKFIPEDGAPALPAVTDAIEARLAPPDPPADARRGTIEEIELVEPHAEHALGLLDGPDLSGLTVVYDAMHGSGRGVTDTLLERAGATVERLRCDRDPTFGGTPPEPGPEYLDALVERVRAGEADLGIANDGDADRIAVVTPERGVLNANLLYAVLYDHLLATDGGPAVRTVSTTFLIDRIAEAHGETVVETPVGFKWVAAAMAEHDALIGGEESGGFTVRGHVREKDGVLMALYAAAMAAAEPIDDRLDRVLEAYGTIHADKVSVDCPDDRKDPVLEALEADLPERIAGTPVESVVTKDGFKLLLADGAWVLMRPSGTEPKMRVYAEAADPDRVDELLTAGRSLVEGAV